MISNPDISITELKPPHIQDKPEDQVDEGEAGEDDVESGTPAAAGGL